MAVSPARRIAFEVLRHVEAERAFAADLLHARIGRADGVKPSDAALATELVFGVLRWQRLLDFLIERGTGKSAEKLDLEVRLALRLGLYQLRFLTRVPARAAVNESVELVKRAGKRSAASLVNAVLRRVPADPVEELLPTGLPPAERLGIRLSHPTWMVERWLRRLGEARTIALLEANNRPPPLAFVMDQAAPGSQILKALTAAGVRVEPGRWLRSALRVRSGNPARSAAFRHGWIRIQDEASQMLAPLLDVRPGQTVLDLCAAPGGKTFQLARAVGPKTPVVAADRYLHRLRVIEARLKRLGLRNVHSVALDATTSLPFRKCFDRILVDAPCSGTGTLARNPEIRWRLRPEDLAELPRRQAALLENALDRLAPSGRLVYATCSLEPEENEQVVEAVLATRRQFRCTRAPETLAVHLVPDARLEALFDPEGYFRTFPPDHQTDGFFAAVIDRSG